MQNSLTKFALINHNTIVNNHKYWLLNPYFKDAYITNNIFINQNWVGEDTNVTNSGQDPDKLFQGCISIDTVNRGVLVQPEYYDGDSTHYTADVSLGNMKVFLSDNAFWTDPLLVNDYYTSATYVDAALGTPPSSLNWAGAGSGPWKIENMPSIWMNTRTTALFNEYPGFVQQKTITTKPTTVTPGIGNAAVVTQMGNWNQLRWGDARFTAADNDITNSAYIFGDYDPTTLFGDGTQGITNFTELPENFKQSGLAIKVSSLDGLNIGSQIWDNAANASYDGAANMSTVLAAYATVKPTATYSNMFTTGIGAFKNDAGSEATYGLSAGAGGTLAVAYHRDGSSGAQWHSFNLLPVPFVRPVGTTPVIRFDIKSDLAFMLNVKPSYGDATGNTSDWWTAAVVGDTAWHMVELPLSTAHVNAASIQEVFWYINGGYSTVESANVEIDNLYIGGASSYYWPIVSDNSQKPEAFSLAQNFPNPFNPSTTINFTLGHISNVKLAVYNVLGQKVATLIDGLRNAGQQSVVFDASRLASGVYFYRLDAGSFSKVQKMMLMK
jgi:hypothetical protein